MTALAAACIAAPATAQNWTAEFGIQSGYTRIKPAGTGASDHVDLFGVPSATLPAFLPGTASIFAIVPVHPAVALETSLTAFQGNALPLLGDATHLNIALRADYAVTSALYAAVGGAVNWIEFGGESQTQTGFHAAAGYRFTFASGLHGRFEANLLVLRKSDLLSPVTAYGMTFGVSSPVKKRIPSNVSPSRSHRAFMRALGVRGGYNRAHIIGPFGGSLTSLSFPTFGASVTALLPQFPAAMPTLFMVLPISEKTALEPGFDFVRIQSSGQTGFAGNASLRADYSLTKGWYGALGGNLLYVTITGNRPSAIVGANLAFGYGFLFSGDIGGRFEINYVMMRQNDGIGSQAANTLGLQFGVLLPLQ